MESDLLETSNLFAMSGPCLSFRFLIMLAAAVNLSSAVWAGPPMVTLDPDILQPGQWQFTAATKTVKAQDGSQATELPVVAAEFAVSPNLMFGGSFRYVHADPGGGSKEEDHGNPAAGLKWRFYNRGGLQLAIAPVHIFGISANAASLGIGSDTEIFSLPLIAGYTFNEWSIVGELAYVAIEEQEDEVAYGVLVGRSVGQRTRLMFEIYGLTNSELDDNFLNFNIGADIAVTSARHLLLSIGSGISEPTSAAPLDYTAYLGIRFFTGR